MSLVEFFLILDENSLLYFNILFWVVIIFTIIFRKRYSFIFDPINLEYVAMIMSTSVVFFLYSMDLINKKYLYNHLLSIAFFFCGFFLVKTQKNKKDNLLLVLPNWYWCLYIILSVSHFFLRIIHYYLLGIPLFMTSRLEVSFAGGGTGLFLRLFSVITPMITYMSYYFVFQPKNPDQYFFSIVNVFFLLLVGFFSGSRSALLGLVLIFGCFVYQNGCIEKAVLFYKKNSIKLFFAGLVFALAVILVQAKGGLFGVLMALLQRIVAFGDVYIYAYVNNNIEKIHRVSFLQYFFADFLTTFRLVDNNFRQLGIGFALMDIITGKIGSTSGPNPRMDIVSYINFGILGTCLFSFSVGIVLGKIRNLFLNYTSSSIATKTTVFLFYYLFISIYTDPTAAIGNITNILIAGVICIFSIFSIQYSK
jgi:uncharacterized membrane protein